MKRKLLKEYPEASIEKSHKRFNKATTEMKKTLLGKGGKEYIKDEKNKGKILRFFKNDPARIKQLKRLEFKEEGKEYNMNKAAIKIIAALEVTGFDKVGLAGFVNKNIENGIQVVREYIFWLYSRNLLRNILLRGSDQYLQKNDEDNRRPPYKDKHGEAKDPMGALKSYNKATEKLKSKIEKLKGGKVNERKIIRNLRNKYKQRLAEAVIRTTLEEVDMYDNRGNMLLAKDLKVRHKASGYEYTVDHVEGEGDEAVVYLRHPEEPRVLPPDANLPLQEETSVSLKGINFDNITGGQELDVKVPEKIDLDQQSLRTKEKASLLAIKRKEFEKEYEVE
jgi:hypothetical protein